MSKVLVGFLVATLAAMVGCDQAKHTAGGPGATSSGAKPPLYGQVDDTFTLTVGTQSAKQGEAREVVVGIKRGTNFDQDVGLLFADLPAGATMTPAGSTLKHGDKDAKVTLKITDAAVPGDYTVKLMGHPNKGGDATTEFKLTVAPKDTFTLSTSFLSPTLKQGEAKAVSVSIKRDATFDQDVTLLFADLPAGVTIDPSGPAIKNGEGESKFTLKAADDAALGTFTVKMTGHPKVGADATHDFKFTIAKK
ncbi:MAG TPA: hypothetical protein VHR66_05610 [Gemmataceae bacterium]|jgi:hypothetical protein|nr:hypothetical protein [Gemmataceae bacterium]